VLAGLLSVMGFSINDTIVVFDRVRENFRSMRAEPLEILNPRSTRPCRAPSSPRSWRS
jgi:preprotein translocase subunit SecF